MERFLKYFVPEKYNLDILIDKDKKMIGGIVTVFGEVKTENIKFHAVKLKITDVLVNGARAEFKTDGEVLEIFKVVPGEATVEIYYEGQLNENMQGAYLSTYEYKGKMEVIVATQFESHYAREAFPCIDEPAAKAIFELKVVVPEDLGDMVISNMPEAKTRSDARAEFGSGYKTVEFEPTPRMSTYLLAWVVGRFHGKTIKNTHGVEITTYAPLNQDLATVDFANEVAAKSLEFYDDNFGVGYPLPKLDQVALPDFEAGAMENWGLVTYRESMLLAGKKATLGTKKSVALTVAHELSHQWFGDLVTMEWWDDLWLNESFASVMEYYAVDAIYPEFKIFEGFFTGDALAALRRDAYSGVQAVHQEVHSPEEIATLFDSAIVYSKGARLMLMLIRLMGWKNFLKGIKEYFKKFEYKNTVGNDLWESLAPYAEFDPKALMSAYIEKPGYPVIKSKQAGFAEFTQERFLLDGPRTKSAWPLPEIAEDMSGHYILNLTEAEFAERLQNFEKLGLEEKLRLLIDRDLVARTDLVSASSLIPLIMKFRNEKSAAVWNIILSIVNNLKIFFDHKSPEEREFKKFVKELVRPGLAELGLKTRKGDDENTVRLRAILLALDFYAENTENLKKLAGMYNSDYTKMDEEIRADILDAKIYLESGMMGKYLEDYKQIADPEIKFDLLFALTVMQDKTNLTKMIDILSQPEVVKPQDQFYLFIFLYRNPLAREGVFAWLRKNWGYVRKMSGDKSLDNYPRYIANVVRTEREFAEYSEFFDKMKDDPAVARAVEVGKNEIRARLDLIEKDRDAVFQALAG